MGRMGSIGTIGLQRVACGFDEACTPFFGCLESCNV